MENAIAIANYFVKKSINTGIQLTPMKLVKLVYIAHGWYLGLTNGQPLIDEPIEAWKYGPVVKSVYDAFKKYGSQQVEGPARLHNGIGNGIIPNVEGEIAEFLDVIWDMYKGYTGVELSALTHQDNTPWQDAWYKEGGRLKLNAKISNEIITKHYVQRLSRPNGEPANS